MYVGGNLRDRRNIWDAKPGDWIAVPVENVGGRWIYERMTLVDIREVPDIDYDEADHEREADGLYSGYCSPLYFNLMDDAGKAHHVKRPGRTYVRNDLAVVNRHHQVCGNCGQLWPCREVVVDDMVWRQADDLDAACVVCDKRADGGRFATIRSETPAGVTTARYHTRKGSRCRTAYVRAVANDPVALAELRQDDAGWARR